MNRSPLQFPASFLFGTSTSASQIETAFEHDWEGIRSKDGFVFSRTTDHELRMHEDVAIIASLAPNYRMSLMWSRLQRGPYAPLDSGAVSHYHSLLSELRRRNVAIMLVLDHWCHPAWFASAGGWEARDGVPIFFDFARKVVDEFGDHVVIWNTFNEPNLYVAFSYALGEFPPFAKDIFRAMNVAKNMAEAHHRVADYLRTSRPGAWLGVSHNCVHFAADNMAGVIPSRIADYLYLEYLPSLFADCDFIGVSYYAKLSFDPFPVSFARTPGKFEADRPHDDIWEYFPDGLGIVLDRFWARWQKPIIITENGVCTHDDGFRQRAIIEYMRVIHSRLTAGVDIRGYYHWSTWDNFEWTLGPTFKFGLYDCNPETMVRTKKASADLYSSLAFSKTLTL